MWIKTIFVFVACALACTESYKLLGIFPIPFPKSHNILATKLMKGLSEAGHDITMVSPFVTKDRPKNGTWKDVVLDGVAEDFNNAVKNMNIFDFGKLGPLLKAIATFEICMNMTSLTIHHPKMISLAASNQKFDAIVMEQFNNDAFKVYGHIFNCPIIVLSSVGPNSWINSVVANPEAVAYTPQVLGGDYTKDLSFYNRGKNLIYYLMDIFIKFFILLPQQDKMIHALYPKAPPLADLYHNVSMILLNSHPSLYPALPTVPNMVEIGGYFVDPPKKLPQDLQKFLDNAPDGVIYFSMGSAIQSKNIEPEKKQAILNVFGKLKQKVLWKFEEDLPGKTSNVMIKTWCPQTDILAHPNVKLFITHGGLLSMTEAIYHGVPVLAIPVFADQPGNAERAVVSGYGLRMDYLDPDFSEKKFGYLVNELLTNPTYRETANAKSKQFHDRPMKPMETVVYWVEYAIRHKGAPHLMVAGIQLPWYKYCLLDVIGAFLASIFLAYYILKRLVKSVFCKTQKSTKKVKRN